MCTTYHGDALLYSPPSIHELGQWNSLICNWGGFPLGDFFFVLLQPHKIVRQLQGALAVSFLTAAAASIQRSWEIHGLVEAFRAEVFIPLVKPIQPLRPTELLLNSVCDA